MPWNKTSTRNVSSRDFEAETAVEMSDADAQKRDLVLLYLLISIDPLCKYMVRCIKCRAEVWETLRITLKKMCKTAVVVKLSRSRNLVMEKGDKVVEYSNRLLKIFNKLTALGIL